MTIQASRRAFLAGAGTLTIGLMLPLPGRSGQAGAQQSGIAGVIRPDAEVPSVFEPNAFIRIAADDTVTILSKHIEFGQGPYTGLATLVAEELDADWSQMRATAAPANVQLYANTLMGVQGTGGSTAMANSYEQMRKAGAAARAMLISAAADRWNVDPQSISIDKGVLSDGQGNTARFGELAEAAAKVDPPVDPQIKDKKDFRLIGTDLSKLDTRVKTRGEAVYALDVYRPGMQTVTVLHPPQFGAKLASFDAAEALKVPGVRAVRAIPQGVAIYADDTYAAFRGRETVTAEWDLSDAERRSSEEMYAAWADAAKTGGAVAEKSGDVDTALAGATRTMEREFRFPFLAHAPMEPIDGVIEVKDGAAEVWFGAQLQTVDHGTLAAVLEMPLDRITIHTVMTGGSFGRRAQPGSPVAAELAEIAKAAMKDGAGDGAYKMVWTRADDVRGGWYRPLTVHSIKAGLDDEGNIVAWENGIANQSIVADGPFAMLMKDGIDPTAVEGSTNMPYDWPAHRVRWARMNAGVPILWWRSVGHTHTAYATETFLDEVLQAAGKDAVEGRLALLQDGKDRDREVLTRVAKMADWKGREPVVGADGVRRARGVALHKSFNTYVAMIAEVSEKDGLPRVEKVWCSIDCGTAVNPNIITAQIEGGVGFGIGAAMFDEITLAEGGRVVQANFDDYRSLRIDEMPEVFVDVVDSDNAPTGVGEPGVPPVAPAVANAWRALTGELPTRLPIKPVGGNV